MIILLIRSSIKAWWDAPIKAWWDPSSLFFVGVMYAFMFSALGVVVAAMRALHCGSSSETWLFSILLRHTKLE